MVENRPAINADAREQALDMFMDFRYSRTGRSPWVIITFYNNVYPPRHGG